MDEALPRLPMQKVAEYSRALMLLVPEKAVEYLRAEVLPELRRLLGKTE